MRTPLTLGALNIHHRSPETLLSTFTHYGKL